MVLSIFQAFLPTPSRPLGLLNPLHARIIAQAQPITLANIVHVGVLPAIPLVIQAYLMQLEADGTGRYKRNDLRKWRMGAGVVGVGLLVRAWTGYRFTRE